MNEYHLPKLAQAVERKSARDKLMRDLTTVREEIQAKAQHVQALKAALEKEAKDVERLESMSLQNLIQSMLGNKAERLEKEQLEEITARIKYETAAQLLEIMRSEEQGLLSRIEPLSEADAALEALLIESSQPSADADKDAADTESRWAALQNLLK